jgi:hypothetical protein
MRMFSESESRASNEQLEPMPDCNATIRGSPRRVRG